MKTTSTIRLTNLTKRFGDIEAVSDVTLAVRAGEVVGFVGPNGAGKTTTISMMMGFIKPTKGAVTILGLPVEPQSAHKVRGSIGYIAGDMELPEHLTGTQYLTFSAAQNGRDKKQYDKLLSSLSPVLDKPLKQLSRGNKQKIALVAALQHAPMILLLDEPTSGLDPLMQEVFLGVVRDEAKRGATVFMSSHILGEVSQVCDRIIFMKGGRFVLDRSMSSFSDQLGKHVIITSTSAPKLAKVLPENVTVLGQKLSELRLSVPQAELKPFLRWIGSKQFDDLVIENRELEDIFHDLYRTDKGVVV